MKKLVNGVYVSVNPPAKKAAEPAVKESVAVEKLSPEVVALKGALARLDPKVDSHWTQAGKPDLNALKEMLGRNVSRGEVDAIAPGFKRDQAKVQGGAA